MRLADEVIAPFRSLARNLIAPRAVCAGSVWFGRKLIMLRLVIPGRGAAEASGAEDGGEGAGDGGGALAGDPPVRLAPGLKEPKGPVEGWIGAVSGADGGAAEANLGAGLGAR